MILNIYVDGSGGFNGGYGFFIKETGKSFYEKSSGITNNQAEYKAIISALQKSNPNDEIHIFSDSKNTVCQINHEFAINSDQLRLLAQEVWSILGKFPKVTIEWVPRNQNLAGKMLGS